MFEKLINFYKSIKGIFNDHKFDTVIVIILFYVTYKLAMMIGAVETLIGIVSMVKAVEFFSENDPKGDTYYIRKCEKLDKTYQCGLINKQSYNERKNELIEKYKKNHKK